MADNWFTRNMGEDFWNFHNDVRRGYLGGINNMPFVLKPRAVQHGTDLVPHSPEQMRKGMYPQSDPLPLSLNNVLALLLGLDPAKENDFFGLITGAGGAGGATTPPPPPPNVGPGGF